MNLGQFVQELRKYPLSALVTIEPFELYPTTFDSYRGYYNELALGYSIEEPEKLMTVEDLIHEAINCIGKEFTGYKGGQFVMDTNTPLWISNYGKCSGAKVREIIMPLNGYVEIYCYKESEY